MKNQTTLPTAPAGQNDGHTPGPWFTATPSHKPHLHPLIGIGNGASHVGYASVTPAMSPGEAEANARLIAAAPELLAALRSLVSASVVPNLRKLPAARKVALAAIAAATKGGAK